MIHALVACALAVSQLASHHTEPAAVGELCQQYRSVALIAGWEPEQWPTLDRLIFRESRCIPTACGVTDSPHLRRCRDWGLLQINDYSWKTTVRSLHLDMEMMWQPFWNLWMARYLYELAEDVYGCGWQPWSLDCD